MKMNTTTKIASAAIATALLSGVASAALSVPLTDANGYEEAGGKYTLTAPAQAVTRINTTGTAVTGVGDDGEKDVNIGFTFNFFGTDYTDIQFNGNGHIYLGTGYNPAGRYRNGANSNSAHPEGNGGSISTNYSGPVIAPWWEDLNINAGGTYYTETRGAPGSQEFVMEWDNVAVYGNGHGSITMQAILKEGSNEILFNYIDVDNTGTNHGNAIGISDDANYHQYGFFTATDGSGGRPANGESLLYAPVPVPEPSSTALLGLGGLALILRRRK